MKTYNATPRLRLRSYESGYVIEKKAKARDGKVHWSGVSWYSAISPALVGLSEYLVNHSTKEIPQAIKEATRALVKAQRAVLAEGKGK